MGHPLPLFHLFSSFQTHITIFMTNICEKMYTMLGFEPTTSHNHKTRAPALAVEIFILTLVPTFFHLMGQMHQRYQLLHQRWKKVCRNNKPSSFWGRLIDPTNAELLISQIVLWPTYKQFTIVIYDSRVIPDLKIPHIMTLDS